MHSNISLQGLFKDTTQLPSGLIVPTHQAQDLIKSEATKVAKEENKARFFSKYAQNIVTYGAREKPIGTPHMQLLYEASKKSFVDSILIRSRIDQTKRIWQQANEGKSKEVGFKVVHKREDDKDYKLTKDDKARCREMQDLLDDPTPLEYMWLYPHQVRPHTRLKDFVGVCTRAELIIDRKCMLRYKRRDGKGYAAFHWLPGETIKNVDEAMRSWAQKNETKGKITYSTVDAMSSATGFDIAKCSHVQMVDGIVVAAFTPDEISVHISNPSDQINRWGYGVSRLEESLDITTSILMAFTYNREMFRTNYPEQVLTVAGDFDKEGLAAFKQQILGEAGGVGNNWRLPVIPAGDVDNFKIESVKLRESPKDMLFDQMIRMLCMLKCAAYGAHPSTINMEMDSGGGSSMFGTNPSSEIEFSKEHGLIPAITDMAEWLTDSLISPRYNDLKVIVVGMNPEDEKQTVDIRTSRVSKWITKNECRMEEGSHTIGFYLPPEQYSKLQEGDPKKGQYDKNPWNYPADVPVTSYLNTFSMADQAQQGQDEGNEKDQQDDQQDDSDQYYKSMQKARNHSAPVASVDKEVKYLKIQIDG
jgi:hypothetical protein